MPIISTGNISLHPELPLCAHYFNRKHITSVRATIKCPLFQQITYHLSQSYHYVPLTFILHGDVNPELMSKKSEILGLTPASCQNTTDTEKIELGFAWFHNITKYMKHLTSVKNNVQDLMMNVLKESHQVG